MLQNLPRNTGGYFWVFDYCVVKIYNETVADDDDDDGVSSSSCAIEFNLNEMEVR